MGYQPPLTADVTTVEGSSATTLVGTANVESVITANTTVAGALQKANNLSDVTTKGSGRFNIRIPSLAAVQCASTTNVNIASAPASVDGFSFISSGLDSVLLTGQSTPSQNGTWVWNGAGSALTRPTDWPAAASITTGRIVQVQNGTVNANTLWMIDVPSSGITIDTTAQTWASLNLLGSTANETLIRANSLNQFQPATGVVTLAGIAGTALAGPAIFTATGSQTWTPSVLGQSEFVALIVGGGGSGRGGGPTQPGGGGGGGEVLWPVYLGAVTGSQTVVVGAGGAGTNGGVSSITGGVNGTITAQGGTVAPVGGAGGNGGDGTATGFTVLVAGSAGGTAAAGTPGAPGGAGYGRYGCGGGAGGGLGAGNSGGVGGGSNGGAGGTSVTGGGGGGGGGGSPFTAGNAGTAGATTVGGTGGAGIANSGGGGGGGGAGTTGRGAGTGGSGYVVIYQVA